MHGSLTGGTKGRFPANVIHDGSDEVEAEFAKAGVSHSSARPNSTRKVYANDGDIYGKYNPSRFYSNHNDTGTPARYFYTAKASPSERGKHNNHPTVKPLALMQYLVRLTNTPNDDIVLDPFMGSGTTLVAAQNEGRRAVGIELSEEYCKIAVERLRQPSFFSIPDKQDKVNG
jgi:site-specific DNA-methyltransferase (adenine-specific)